MDIHDHEIEFAASSPVERADARLDATAAALRNAPAWVRERLSEIRSEAGDDTVVERRGGVEYASEDRATAYAERSLRLAPPHIRAKVNEHRRRSGLTEIAYPRPEPTGPGVWVLDKRTGRLVPASAAMTTTASRSPTRPTPTRRATLASIVERVLILPCPAFAEAPARHVGSTIPESISARAFGPAHELNRDRGFDLRLGHHGPLLALAGDSLRAHDTPHGTVIEWLVDGRVPASRDALRAIAARCGVSVSMKIGESRTMRLPSPTSVVTRARLEHVALLTNDQAAYPAATAIRFPGSTRGSDDELARQIDKLVAEARFRSWRKQP